HRSVELRALPLPDALPISYERDLAPIADSQQLGVMPRFALAAGFLSGEYRSKADLKEARRSEELALYVHRRGLRVLSVLEEVARSEEHTSELQSRENLVCR